MSRIINYAKSLLNRKVDSKNIFINGNFDIWQRGVSFNSQGYTADRWFFSIFENEFDNQGATAFKCTTDGQLDNNTYGISLKNTVSGCYYSLMYVVPTEDVLSHQGEQMTLGFYAKTPDNSLAGNIYSSVSYTPHEDDPNEDKTLIATSVINSAITTGWKQYNSSFEVPSDARTLVFEIRPETTSGLAANSTLNISQAKLELGFIPTQLIPNPYNEELKKCEAFYQKTAYAQAIPPNTKQFTNSVKLNTKPRKPYSASVNIPRIKNKSRGILNISPYIKENALFINADSSNASTNNILLDSIIIDNEIYPEGVPSTPTDIYADDNLITSGIVVYWSASQDRNSKIREYNINYGLAKDSLIDNESFTVNGEHIAGTAVSGSITGVDTSKIYYFNLAAINDVGESPYSTCMTTDAEGTPTTSGLSTYLPTVVPLSNKANVSWNYSFSPNTIPDKFIVDCDVVSSFDSSFFSRKIVEYELGDSLTTDIAYLNNNSGTFFYQIAPQIGSMTGIFVGSSLSRTTPGDIDNIITYSSNTSVSLYWSDPDSDGGYPVTGYALQYSSNSGTLSSSAVTHLSRQGINNSTNISSLNNDTEYFFRLAALNFAGTGNFSSTTAETPGRSPATCSAPTGVSLSWDSDLYLGSDIRSSRDLSEQRVYSSHSGYSNNKPTNIYSMATIQWSTPIDNGGQSIAYYNVLLDTTSSFNSSNLKSYNTNLFRTKKLKLINQLTSDTSTTWYAKCAAVNASGTGLYSNSASLSNTTPQILNVNGSEFKYNFNCKGLTNAELEHTYTVNDRGLTINSGISYTGVDCSSLIQYSVVACPTDENNTELTITGLEPGFTYSFGAAYSNASGNSTIVCSTGATPDSLSTNFNSDTITLGTIENNRDLTPFVTILVKRPTTSIGALNYSGVFYTGNPATYPGEPLYSGYFYRYGRSSYRDRVWHDSYGIEATLTGLSTELWLSTVACSKNSTTTYTSQPVNFNIWNALSKPKSAELRVQRILSDRIYFEWDELGYSDDDRGNDTISNYSHELYYVTSEEEYQLLTTIAGTNTVGPGVETLLIDIDNVFGSNYALPPSLKNKFVLRTKNSSFHTDSVAYATTSALSRNKLMEYYPMYRVVYDRYRDRSNATLTKSKQTFSKPLLTEKQYRSVMAYAPSSLIQILQGRPIYEYVTRYTYAYIDAYNEQTRTQAYAVSLTGRTSTTPESPAYARRIYSTSSRLRELKALETDENKDILYTMRYSSSNVIELGYHSFATKTRYTFTNGIDYDVSFVKDGDNIMAIWIEQV